MSNVYFKLTTTKTRNIDQEVVVLVVVWLWAWVGFMFAILSKYKIALIDESNN